MMTVLRLAGRVCRQLGLTLAAVSEAAISFAMKPLLHLPVQLGFVAGVGGGVNVLHLPRV